MWATNFQTKYPLGFSQAISPAFLLGSSEGSIPKIWPEFAPPKGRRSLLEFRLIFDENTD
ncbi:MAG: hypothetical protein CL700_01010 [Chloroflexi bacterium]|nr:hypothetical protein [Chloroflexota bacterium]